MSLYFCRIYLGDHDDKNMAGTIYEHVTETSSNKTHAKFCKKQVITCNITRKQNKKKKRKKQQTKMKKKEQKQTKHKIKA